jgi:dimethylargininase
MFTGAITRIPGKSIVHGLTSSPELGKPDHGLALRQHEKYVRALELCGLTVDVLEPLEEFPDSCFVEDVCIITEKCIVMTRPGAPARKDEPRHIRDVLLDKFPSRAAEAITGGGTLDGGDVCRVDDHFHIGISDRTNESGGVQLIRILEKHGFTGSLIPVRKGLHLKSGLTYLDHSDLVISAGFLHLKEFRRFRRIVVPEADAYSANCLWINGKVLVPSHFGQTSRDVAAAGYEVLEIDMSEFRKVDGGLSCLSLRY